MALVDTENPNYQVICISINDLSITIYTIRTPNALATPATVRSEGSGPTPPYMKTCSESFQYNCYIKVKSQSIITILPSQELVKLVALFVITWTHTHTHEESMQNRLMVQKFYHITRGLKSLNFICNGINLEIYISEYNTQHEVNGREYWSISYKHRLKTKQ